MGSTRQNLNDLEQHIHRVRIRSSDTLFLYQGAMGVISLAKGLLDLLELFADETPCRYDAQGSCLEHGMTDYKAEEKCPQALLRLALGDDIEGTRGRNSEVEGS